MKLKKLIAIICIFTLGTQMLPVQQIGSVLFGNQINEELPHNYDSKEKESKGDIDFTTIHSSLPLFSVQVSAYLHFAVSLPSSYSKDVHTPPPNVV
jgi:hypothetical protein